MLSVLCSEYVISKSLLIYSILTDNHLNVLNKDGVPNPDVWAIGDAAIIQDQRLPATAQGSPLKQNY